jgi:hypothetical protein
LLIWQALNQDFKSTWGHQSSIDAKCSHETQCRFGSRQDKVQLQNELVDLSEVATACHSSSFVSSGVFPSAIINWHFIQSSGYRIQPHRSLALVSKITHTISKATTGPTITFKYQASTLHESSRTTTNDSSILVVRIFNMLTSTNHEMPFAYSKLFAAGVLRLPCKFVELTNQ